MCNSPGIQWARWWKETLLLFQSIRIRQGNVWSTACTNIPPYLPVEYVTQLEDLFISSFSVYTKSSCVGKTILAKLKSAPHLYHSRPVQESFLRMTIYYSLKFANRDFTSTKKKDRKYIYTLRSHICNQVNSRTF